MRPRLRTLVPLLACAARAARPGSGKPVKNLWATVNRCDTPTSPNTIGVRASMPGTKYRSRLYMRFRIQFWSATRQSFVDTDSSSRWLRVGDGRAAATQSGFNFRFDDPPEGEQFVLRGVVQYRYTRCAGARRQGQAALAGREAVRAAHPLGPAQRAVGGPARVLLLDVHRQAGNRRGSFVITASTPSASRRAICFASSTVHT